jgi:hypothetical protein
MREWVMVKCLETTSGTKYPPLKYHVTCTHLEHVPDLHSPCPSKVPSPQSISTSPFPSFFFSLSLTLHHNTHLIHHEHPRDHPEHGWS